MLTINIVLTLLSTFFLLFTGNLIRIVVKARHSLENSSWWKSGLIGLVANFCDTLGIGSFAITIPLLKLFKQSKDDEIPGTLNVGASLPTMCEALIFIHFVKVDPLTLCLLMITAALGAWSGARYVAKLPAEKIKMMVGIALFVTAFFIFITLMGWMPHSSETAIGLRGIPLFIGAITFFFIGSITAVGIGGYAPSLAMAFVLGLSPRAMFPIMMGASGFLIPTAGIKFMQEDRYNKKTSLAFGLVGIIGVLIAAYIVKSLPLHILQWVVIGILLYTATIMLKPSR